MSMEILMKASGNKTKPMDMEYISTQKLEPNTKDTGKKICSMAQECKLTLMVINIKGCLNRGKEMEKAGTI